MSKDDGCLGLAAIVAVGLLIWFFSIVFGSGAPRDYSYSWWTDNCNLVGTKEAYPIYECVGVPHKSTWYWPNYDSDPKIKP